MEDLKQIQEFFSKPLNENVHVEAFKLQKALKGMGYDVKVKAVDDFGKNVFEIYFNNPADADDDSIFYDVEKLGYDNVRVFANPQESLDEEKVNRKKLSNDLWDRKGYDYKYLNKLSDKKLKSLWDTEFYHESLDEAYIVTYAKSKGEKPASAAYKHRGSALAFMRDLEKDGYITMLTQKPVDGVDESVKENSHFEKRLAKMAADEKEKRAKNPSYAAASKLDVDIEDFFEKGQSYQEFKKRLDKLKEYNSGIYFNPDKTTPRPKVKDAAKSGIEKVKDVLKKIMKEQESNPDAELKVGDYQTKYFYICPGAKSLYQDIEDKVDDMGLAIRAAKLQDALFAIEASALESGATEAEVFAAQSIADQIMAMAAMMGLDKEHSYIQGHVDKIKGTLNENAFIAMMGANSVKDKDKPKEKDEKDYSNEAKVDDIKETIKFIKENNPSATTEEVIAELKEIKELGKTLEEKLCKKGEAYRKRRMAAGEKSSAYLSGRAVKVCKGQMSGRKKRKKRKSKK